MDKRLKIAGMKKFNQQDLRRLMLEQKLKTNKNKSVVAEKIDSPLAKYDSLGGLSCVICKTNIKSETVWKVHVNSKQHKQKVEAALQLKEKLLKQNATSNSRKRANDSSTTENVQKKTMTTATTTIAKPDTLEGNQETTQSIVKNNIGPQITAAVGNHKNENESTTSQSDNNENVLPEKFFDDPVKDAKIRNEEYKDPKEEEWERFQMAIKEEYIMSNAIIAGEQDVSAVEREIEEIDEQIEKYAKVLNLEQRKELILKRTAKHNSNNNKRSSLKCDAGEGDSKSDEENDDDDDTFAEFSDWRSKKFHK